MKTQMRLVANGMIIAALMSISLQAQQITGTPGSPSATTTVDGNYLPNPPAKFGGVINLRRQEFQTVLAAQCRAAQGRAECAPHHDG